jgi:hypothetical protein
VHFGGSAAIKGWGWPDFRADYLGVLSCSPGTRLSLDYHSTILAPSPARLELELDRAGLCERRRPAEAVGLAWAWALKSFSHRPVYFVWRIANEIHRAGLE